MELKFTIEHIYLIRQTSFNRTFMELKYNNTVSITFEVTF